MLTQHLYELNRASTQFPEQLNELLQDEEWVERLQSLPKGELVELIGYLDNVSTFEHQLNPTHRPRRSSTVLIARVRRSERASTCCGKFVARRLFSP